VAELAALRASPYVKVLILLLFVKVAKIANLAQLGSLALAARPALESGNTNG
jgi:hypothetical protein